MSFKLRLIRVILTLTSLPVMAAAQLATSASSSPVEIGGTATVDVVTLRGPTLSVPLRKPGVVPGSMRITLDGRTLNEGTDYSIDSGSGVVYLKVQTRLGSSLVAHYRFDPLRARTREANSQGLGLQLRGSGLSFALNFGGAERLEDGRVLSANTLGWNNSFKTKGSGLRGMVLFNDKSQVDSRSGYEFQAAASGDEVGGASRAIVQSFESGALKLNYQEVGKGFTGLAGASNVDAQTAAQLLRERGLLRKGLQIDKMAFGGGKLSQSLQQVKDGSNFINWRTFGFSKNGLDLNWSSRKIDPGFSRFNDLSEADRSQLQAEAGLARESYQLDFKPSRGVFHFGDKRISQLDGSTLAQRSFSYEGTVKFSTGSQSIDQSFNRFGSLAEGEKGQWSREAGLRRNWLGLGTKFLGSNFDYSKSAVESATSRYDLADWALGNSRWYFKRTERLVQGNFGYLGNLSGEEQVKSVRSLATLWAPSNGSQDVGGYNRSQGIDRVANRLDYSSHGWKLNGLNYGLFGMSDKATNNSLDLANKDWSFGYQRQAIGNNFNELGALMDFERQGLGVLTGLDRTVAEAKRVKGSQTQRFSWMTMDSATGGAKRAEFELAQKGLSLQFGTRKVDPGFSQVNQTLDSEKDWLSQIRGFGGNQLRLGWQVMPSLKLDGFFSDLKGIATGDKYKANDFQIAWSATRSTTFTLSQTQRLLGSDQGRINDQTYRNLGMIHDFGRLGKLTFGQERFTTDGTEKAETSSARNTVKWQSNLSRLTQLSIENSTRNWVNGAEEEVMAQTLSTNLTKRSGISLTQSEIRRKGLSAQSQETRQLGAWLDLGKGVKIEYGSNRSLADGQNGQLQSHLNVSQGTIGDLQIGGNYSVNRMDNTNTQSTSHLSLSSSKGFRFGSLNEIRFGFGTDTQANAGNYQRSGQDASFSAKLLGSSFGLGYKSQVDTGSQYTAIDRGAFFSTDQSPAAKLRASVAFKLRKMPNEDEYMIRTYSFAYKPSNGIEISNVLSTNPETNRPDLLLGTYVNQVRTNKWQVAFTKNPNCTLIGSYDENFNGPQLSRTGGITWKLAEAKGSPFSIFVGAEAQAGNGYRRVVNRYSLSYTPRPSTNKQFSIFVGNVNYHATVGDRSDAGLSLRLDYTVRF